ncbi:MAG: tetratricopeptide repeat protein [Deltaproteobacteria bacterium]|nr:tetratricopeptide repeat protein [Deltaproteobacteria bacterium]
MAQNLRYDGFRSWRELVERLEVQAGQAEGPARAQLLLRTGLLREARLGEQSEANKAFKEAYRSDKQCYDALRGARRLLRLRGKVDEKLLQLFEIEFKALKKAQRAADGPVVQAASAHIDYGWALLIQGSPAKAVAEFKQALYHAPDDLEIQGLVEDFADETDPGSRVADLRAAAAASAGEPAKAARLLLRAAAVAVVAGADDSARADLLQAAALDPDDDTALLYLEARALGNAPSPAQHEKLAREVIDRADDERTRGRLAHTLACRLLAQIDDPGAAVPLHEVAFELQPDDERTFEFLLLLYKARGEKQRVRDLTARAAAAAGADDARAYYLATGAWVLAREMNGAELVGPLATMLAEAAPGHPALAELAAAGVAVEKQDAPAAASVAAEAPAEAPAAPAPAAPAPAVADNLLDQDLPADLATQADDASALEASSVDKALAAWRKLLDAAPPSRTVIEGIRRVCRQTRRWNYLVDAFKKTIDKLPETDVPERTQLLFELADTYLEDMGQKPSALQPLQQAHQLDPLNVDAIDRLLALFDQLNRPADHVKLLVAKADALVDPVAKVEVLLQVAQLYQEKFRNVGEAIKAYQKVLDVEPTNFVAVAALKEIFEQRKDWESFVNLARREIEATDDVLARLERTVALAQLATEKIRKPEICIQLWEQARSYDAANVDALQALVPLYERAKEYEKLADVLRQQVDLVADAAARKDVLLKLGLLYGDKVADDGSSIGIWRQVMELDPNDRRAPEQIKKRFLALRAWDELEGFYTETNGRWDELVRLVEKEAGGAGLSTEEKVGAQMKIAQVWLDKLQKADRAAAAYQEVLKLDETNRAAAQALVPLYEQLDQAAALAHVLEIVLGHLEDPTEKYATMVRIGALLGDTLQDAGQAFAWYARAFELDPTQPELHEALERVAGQAGKVETLVGLFRGALKGGQVVDQLAMRQRTARLLDEGLGRPEEALKDWEEVLQGDPTNADALLAIERLYTQMGRFQDLLEILDKRRGIAASAEEENQILVHIARVWEEALNNRDEAINVYRQVLDARGDDPEILRALQRLYEDAERWADLLEMVERQRMLAAPGTPEYRDLVFRVAQICQTRLGDLGRAVEGYRSILEEDPGFQPAVDALEPALADAEHRAEVAGLLAGIFEQREDWPNLVRVTEVLADVADLADEKIGHLRRIAEIQVQRLAQPDRAFETHQRALRLSPQDEQVLVDIEQLASLLDAWPTVTRLLVEVVEAVEEREVRLRLWLKVATIRENFLSDPKGATLAYQKALEADGTALDALDALERLFESEERHEELQDIYRRRVSIEVDPGRKEFYYAQMAFIHDEILGRSDDAIACYRDILAFDPSNDKALRALELLYRRLERWAELADVFGRLLEKAETPEEGTALKLQLAELRYRQMKEVDVAIDLYREILEADAHQGEAVRALEQILAQPDFELTVARTLEPVYRELQDFPKLIAVQEILVKHAETAHEKVDLLHQVAQLHEVAGDNPEEALNVYARALHEDPADEPTLEHIERLARVLGRPERLVLAIEQEVGRVEDLDLLVRLHARAAEMAEREMGDLDRAIQHHRAVLAKDPSSMDALASLERIYATTERYEDLALVYLKKAEVVQDPAEVKEQFFQAGRIYEEILDRRDRAIAVFLSLHEFDPEDMAAIDKLILLYMTGQSWNELLALYEKKSDLVGDLEEKKRILLEMGAVFRLEVKDQQRAIDTYKRILELDPLDVQAIAQLDELYEETESWHELLHILERESDIATDPNDVLAYRFRAGRIWEQRLDNVPRAIELYRGVLDANPEHQPAIGALEALMTAGKEALSAAAVLGPLYEQAGEWRKLIATYEVEIAQSDDAFGKVELLHKVAELYERPDRLNEPENAFSAYAKAFRIDPLNELSLESLERIASMLELWAKLSALYDEGVASAAEPDLKVALGLRAARVYEEEESKPVDAILRLRGVLEVDPENNAALRGLDRLYRATAAWRELVEILPREEGIAENEDEALMFKFDRGQVLQQELQDVSGAITAYREILDINPQHAATRASLELLYAEGAQQMEIAGILEPIYQAGDEWERLARLLEHKVELYEEPVERIEVIQRIAELYENRLGAPESAFQWLGRGLLLAPDDDRTADELDRLAPTLMTGWEDLARIYAQILTTVEAGDIKLRAGKKLAYIYEEQIGDAERTQQVWEHLLEVDGHDPDVLVALDRIYSATLGWERLSEILKRRVEVEGSRDEQVEILTRLGRLHLADLGDMAGSEVAFRRIIDQLGTAHLPALEGLEQIYGQTGEWPKLYEVYRKQADAVLGEAAQSEVFAKMALLAADALEKPDEAVALWQRVLDIRGEEPEPLRNLIGLYEQLGRWDDVGQTVDRLVNIVDDEQERSALYLKVGDIRHQQLGRPLEALDAYQQALDLDSMNVMALRRKATIHAESEAWEDLIETLQRLVDVGEGQLAPEELAETYAQMGTVLAERLERTYEAIDAWRKVLVHAPRDPQALDRLEALLKREERWQEVVEVLEQRVELLGTAEEQIALWREVADLWKDRIGERNGSTTALEAILALQPDHEPTFLELEQAYTDYERWDELVALYGRKYQLLEGHPAQRAIVLTKIGRIYLDKKHDEVSAYGVYKAAYLEDFNNLQIAAELERVANAAQSWDDLLATLSAKIAELGPSRPAIPLYLAAGRWYARQLKRLDYAIQIYATVLGKIDSANVDALLFLADAYRDMKQWPALVQTLTRCIEVVDDKQRKKEIYVQLGQTQEEILNDEHEAMAAYRAAIDIDADHPVALAALDRLYRHAERWEDLVPIVERRIGIEQDETLLIELKLDLAELFEDRLGRDDHAIKVYRDVLDRDGSNERALKGLERLYARSERWQDLLDILELELDHAESERERLTLLERMAAMLEEEFLRHEDAAARLEQVLEIDPRSENALTGLERLYRQLQRWEELATTYGRHVDAVVERPLKIQHLKSQADVFLTNLADPDRAVESLRQVLDHDPDDGEALDHLAALLDQRGDAAGSLEMLERLAGVATTDPLQQVDILTRVGTVLEKQLNDRAGAIIRFEQALAIVPEHLTALTALREIYVDNQEWVLSARILDREQEATPSERQRSRVLTLRGQILQQQLNNEAEAVSCFEQSLQLDPENDEAGEPLVAIYMRDQQYDKADPVLDMLLRRFQGKRTAQELRPLHMASAEAAEALGNTDKALRELRVAYQADPSDLEVIRRTANVHYKRKEWDGSFKFYQMILVQHMDKLAAGEKVEIYFRLGNIKMAVKEVRKALNMYEKALDLDPNHRTTLDALVALFEGQRDFEQVIHFKKQKAETAPDDEKFQLLDEIGDIWREKLNNIHKAIQSYVDALGVKADDRLVLVKLLKLYTETKQWPKAIEVAQRVVLQETEPKRLAAYYQLIATTYRDEIKDTDKAIDFFDKALDADAENLKNFEAIEKILTPRRDWKALERAYRRMIKRLPETGKELLKETFLHNLGEIARTRLKNFELAAECFRLASDINPDNRMRHEILAELYVMMPGRWEDAVQEHQALLRQDPKRVESYRALRRIYQDAGKADETWCLCAALTFLNKAEANEKQFFEQYRPKSPPAVRGTVGTESWYKYLYHHEENVYVSKIFESITPAVRQGMVTSTKAFGLRRKDLQDPATSQLALAKSLRDAAIGLGLPLPELYVVPEQPGGLTFAFTEPPASVAGADYLSGVSPMELRFVTAKHLSSYRREHYLQYLLHTTAGQMQVSLTQVLLMYLYAAVKLGMPDAEVPTNDAVMQVAKHLQQHTMPQDREMLHAAAIRFLDNPVKNIKPWMIAADLTGDRAGLLLCGDLPTAAKMMTRVPSLVTDLTPTQRVTELCVFAISDGYFRLRKELGISLGTG